MYKHIMQQHNPSGTSSSLEFDFNRLTPLIFTIFIAVHD